MAGNTNQLTLRNSIPAYAIASLPLISPVPIQEVQLLDYAVAHKTVNSSYGLTANASDTYVIGKDPYTSDEQRVRDQYEINDTDWHEVSFKEVIGLSSCKLALHQDWIESHDYMVDGIVNMNLPEQGISGPFKITSIRHIQPQKIPVDEDPDDDYEYRPVTGLFTHQSDDVYSIGFSDAITLGITATHPIYSTTYHDWRLAGELEVGERVLTYKGEATVSSTEKRAGSEPVYNLEVKDLHNFLVGDVGVVVHNTGLCDFMDHIFKGKIEIIGGVPGAYKFKITGVHHHGALDGVKVRIKAGTKSTPNSKGYYKGKVEMHHPDNPNNGGWTTKDKESTFFPETWDKNRVTEEITNAMTNKKPLGGNKFEGTMSDGTKLQMYFSPGKEFPDTAFPIID